MNNAHVYNVYLLKTHHSWSVDSDWIHLAHNFGVVTEVIVGYELIRTVNILVHLFNACYCASVCSVHVINVKIQHGITSARYVIASIGYSMLQCQGLS